MSGPAILAIYLSFAFCAGYLLWGIVHIHSGCEGEYVPFRVFCLLILGALLWPLLLFVFLGGYLQSAILLWLRSTITKATVKFKRDQQYRDR